jgi:MOSC domain-containing protein YiiM
VQTESLPQSPLLAVLTGQVQRLGQSEIFSAIAKSPRQGAVRIGPLGVEGDQQGQPGIHGGPEKAVLHYGADHYATWATELPQCAARFQPGGFGENLACEGMDETSMCIGDVVSIGGAVLQVAQPRQPCFKLNHRFDHADMARRTQQSGRTGWYYRVLQPGLVQAGDAVVVTERPHPRWTVRQVQRHLYVDRLNGEALSALATLAPLAQVMRQVFARRLASAQVESFERRLTGQEPAGS